MRKEYIQSLLLIGFAIIVFVAREYSKHGSPTQVVKVWAANCEFPDPGEYVEGPYAPSLAWCEDGDKQAMVNLMNHMKLHSAQMDASIASEFGVQLRVGYLTLDETFLINPVWIVEEMNGEDAMIECTDSVGNDMISKFRPDVISVEFISSEFKRTKQTFKGKNSCLVQLMLDTML